MAKGKKLPAKPTMAQAFNAAQGPAVNRPKTGNGYQPGPIKETTSTEREYPTAQQIAKMKTDEARRKPIKDTRSTMQKLQTKFGRGFSGTATVGYKEGQVISTTKGKKKKILGKDVLLFEPVTKVSTYKPKGKGKGKSK